MKNPLPDRALWLLLAGWAAFALASLWLRPLWPVDETRYASVAWEMWLRGDFLVPWVNGEPYSHKPPLLFWLIHAGWALFGVNDWWPRLVAPLCALAAAPLMLKLARLLWPEERATPALSVWLLFGTLLFASFVTLLMFDLLLLLCVLAAMIGVATLANGQRRAGILWLGAGIGLGVLAKGPVVLLHVLPAALVAPWWTDLKGRLGQWYLDIFLGTLLGAAIALAWALPAGHFGGEAYRNAIFWGQTAGRVAESFAHRAPWWYYAPLLPLILFPWFVWPRLWSGFLILKKEPGASGSKFLLSWLLLTVISFSLVSGKQAKYLLPMLPAFALLAAHALASARAPARLWHLLPPLAGFLALPAGLAYLRTQPGVMRLPDWAGEIPLWPLLAMAIGAPALLAFARSSTSAQVRALSVAGLAASALLLAGVAPAFAPYGDPRPAAWQLAALQELKLPLAYLGKYHAQYNFAGRLRSPIQILDHAELRGWVERNPEGRVLTVERSRHAAPGPQPEYQAPFRGAHVQIWRGAELLNARPELR